MSDGDIVIDLDYILAALEPNELTRKKDNPHVGLALDIRDFLFDKIENCDKKIKGTVWICTCLPEKGQREDLERKLNGDLIHIDTGKEICMQRSIKDNLYNDLDYSKHVVEDYWQRFEE